MERSLKVLSYNIHKGFALTQNFVLEAIRENIRRVGADIVFLQEVQAQNINHQKRINGWPHDQLEYLADSIWPHYAYGKNAVYDAGHHGNAILSKYPIVGHENIDISNNRFERRGILHAVVDTQSGPSHLLNVHLDLTASGRKNQCDRIVQRIELAVPERERLILAGDFNDWRGLVSNSFETRLGLIEAFLKTQGTHAKTFPSIYPMLTLDRIYLRGYKPIEALTHTGSPWSRLSDHLAIETKLQPE